MGINTHRYDLSDWLIHFFRDIDFDSPNSISYIEHMGWGNINEDTKYSALFMLRCALRQGRLWATWSYRNHKRTIYGNSPAVCFSEMPIAAFLEAGEARQKRGEAMSPFALIFPKKDIFSSGGNPVIYGLDERNIFPKNKQGEAARVFDEHILPIREQYRYVTYNPASHKPIDWSHEREWRWPFRGDTIEIDKEVEEWGMIEDSSSIPGFDFYDYHIKGMGVVVKTREQAMWIIHDILVLVDKRIIGKETFRFVLPSNCLPPLKDLRGPDETEKAISDSLINLEPFFSYPNEKLLTDYQKFKDIIKQINTLAENPQQGEIGGCWLWLLDNTATLTRSLLKENRVIISKSGKYLVKLNEFSSALNLRQREKMTQSLAKKISSEFNIECGYFSVLGSENPDAVPFYNDDHLDNHMYYNFSGKKT